MAGSLLYASSAFALVNPALQPGHLAERHNGVVALEVVAEFDGFVTGVGVYDFDGDGMADIIAGLRRSGFYKRETKNGGEEQMWNARRPCESPHVSSSRATPA